MSQLVFGAHANPMRQGESDPALGLLQMDDTNMSHPSLTNIVGKS